MVVCALGSDLGFRVTLTPQTMFWWARHVGRGGGWERAKNNALYSTRAGHVKRFVPFANMPKALEFTALLASFYNMRGNDV